MRSRCSRPHRCKACSPRTNSTPASARRSPRAPTPTWPLSPPTSRLPRPQPARPARPPAPGRRQPLARAAAGSGGCLVIAFAAMQVHRLADPGNAPGTLPASLALPSFRVALTAVFAALFIVIAGAATAVEQRRSLRQLPPRQGGRPCPGRRPARRRRPWPGSHWPSHRPDQRGPAGPQVTAAPAACSRAGGSAPRGAGRDMTLVNPAQGTVPARLTGLGLTP